jgi:hypothetical protein
LWPSSLVHHSSSEWAFPPLPPHPIVIEGIPFEIGIFELVDPLINIGEAPK